jgi:ABC-type Zn uptake system ZnuABC Zn-binding protein ZnuA
VVERARAENARLVLASPYFDPRHARFVAERSGAKVVEMAHQVGARAGTGDYLAMIDYNVRAVLAAL